MMLKGPKRATPSPASGRRGAFALAALVTTTLALAIPGALKTYERSLGPLDISIARQGSVIAVDRDGKLLRAFTTADGRWRLPAEVTDVDPKFFTLLEAYEDKRFRSHGGVDWLAMSRAVGQFARNGRVI